MSNVAGVSGAGESRRSTERSGSGSGSGSGFGPAWLLHLPVVLMLGWWLADLSHHWLALPEFQHGWLVAPLAGFLVWERWETKPEGEAKPSGWGPVVLAAAMLPWLVLAELYQYAVARSVASSFVLSLGCAGFLVALLWCVNGWRVARHFLFPILFLFVAVPVPKMVWNPVVFGLQGFIAGLNVETLNLFGIAASRSGHLIVLPTGVVGVDEACSGIRSLQSAIMAALFIGDLTFRRLGVKLFFMVAGVILAVAGNFFRSVYLSMTAARRGVEAVGGVHDAAGWSVLVFTVAGLAFLAWRVARVEAASGARTTRESK